ncbi:hypothetical protein [aff. Roholtiella sp. LEGE 12411]|uniref:hypothetical protein n=1 Tax=aff. Roholtiella sp. LEGE 12411 TaxID=1828822 RepID=UPI0030DA847C
MPYAPSPIPYALCPMPYALCPMPYALCPMPYPPSPIPCLYKSVHESNRITIYKKNHLEIILVIAARFTMF